MSSINTVVSALYTRISTYTSAGSALSDVKYVSVGSTGDSRTGSDIPIIEIIPLDARRIWRHQPHGSSQEIRILVRVIENKLESDNRLADLLSLLTKVLNAVETNPATGAVDLNLLETIDFLPQSLVTFYEDQMIVWADIEYTLTSSAYQSGAM